MDAWGGRKKAGDEDTETAFTLPALNHAERIVHALMLHYPAHTRAACEEAAAALCGYPAWVAMLNALQSDAPAGPYDEDLSSGAVMHRRTRQHQTLLSRLLGVTDAHHAMARRLDAEVLAQEHEPPLNKRYSASFHEKRLRRAAYAYHMAYARQVIEQVRPTARAGRTVPADIEDVDLSLRIDLLPRALSAWLGHNAARCLTGAGELHRIHIRQQATTDLLDFAFMWSELWMQREADIPRPLQIYPVVLCARWYAWATCARMSHLHDAIALIEGPDGIARRSAAATVQEALRAEEAAFLLTQPREEFRLLSAAAREEQIRTGAAMLRRHLATAARERTVCAILAGPGSLAMPGWTALA